MDYKTVLENEFMVTRENVYELFDTSEVFVCGYGSLLYSSGWYSRNMMRPPKKKDLIECRVDGYKRGTFGMFIDPIQRFGIHFYGVVPKEGAHLNGTLVRIHSIGDWVNLMATECIAGIAKNYNYRCVDITDKITGVDLKPGQVVHMVVNEPANETRYTSCFPAPGYYKEVTSGVKQERSLDFQREFYATGGLTTKQASIIYKNSRLYR